MKQKIFKFLFSDKTFSLTIRNVGLSSLLFIALFSFIFYFVLSLSKKQENARVVAINTCTTTLPYTLAEHKSLKNLKLTSIQLSSLCKIIRSEN